MEQTNEKKKPTNQAAVALIEPLLEPILLSHLIWTSF